MFKQAKTGSLFAPLNVYKLFRSSVFSRNWLSRKMLTLLDKKCSTPPNTDSNLVRRLTLHKILIKILNLNSKRSQINKIYHYQQQHNPNSTSCKWRMRKAYFQGAGNKAEFVLHLLFWNHNLKSRTVIYLTLLLSVVETGKQQPCSFSSTPHIFFSSYFHLEHCNQRLQEVRQIHIPVSTKYKDASR